MSVALWHVNCDCPIRESLTVQTLIRGGAMKELLTRMWRNEDGQDLAEYALLIALIALVVIGAVTLLGTNIQAVFNLIANALNP